jgi:hypothetical protein
MDAAPAAELTLSRRELLGLAAVLPHELAGLQMGELTPSRQLNARTGRCWSAAQWWTLLAPHYRAIVAPPPRPHSSLARRLREINVVNSAINAAPERPALSSQPVATGSPAASPAGARWGRT